MSRVDTTLLEVRVDPVIFHRQFRKFAMFIDPPLDNRSRIRYDIVEKIMKQEEVLRTDYVFNGTNILTRVDLSFGPWNFTHLGTDFTVALEILEVDEVKSEESREFLNRILNRAMEAAPFDKVREKYVVGRVDKRVFDDPYTEVFKGFAMTIDLLATTLVLKHKICHRVANTRTLDKLPENDIKIGDQVTSVYDAKNTYFFENFEDVHIDAPMDGNNAGGGGGGGGGGEAAVVLSLRQYYIRKFEKKLQSSCLKQALYAHALDFMKKSAPVVKMVSVIHEKDGKPCKLFRDLTTKVEIRKEILAKIPQVCRVDPKTKFQEISKLSETLQKKRPEASFSPRQILDAWGVQISDRPLSATTMNIPAPLVTIAGHAKVEQDLKPQYMKDVKLSSPMVIPTIGVYYEKAALNVATAFWPAIEIALRRKNASIGKIDGPLELRSARNVNDILGQLRQRSSAPLTCYVFFLSGDKHYASLKEKLTGEKKVVTQFVQAQLQRQNLGNAGSRTIITHNIALQIMCKLGACPWTVQIPSNRPALSPEGRLSLLVVGIDVSHGQKRWDRKDGISRRMSYVGLSAYFMERTSKGNSTTFFGMTVQQTGGQEILDSGSLKTFFDFIVTREHFPYSVVVFRDGVGKGQVQAVQEVEAVEVQNTLLQKAAELGCPRPKLAYTIVTKRIMEDFGKNRGTQPVSGGLAVTDPAICGPNECYMVTDKRTGFVHYRIIDINTTSVPTATATATDADADADATSSTSAAAAAATQAPLESIPRDDVMLVAYNTAYQFFNWPGPVKIPAALQYAHTISKLAGEHFDKEIKLERKQYTPHRGLMYI